MSLLLILVACVTAVLFMMFFFYRRVDREARRQERRRILEIAYRAESQFAYDASRVKGNNFGDQMKRSGLRGGEQGIREFIDQV